jgi:hypothetical protein
MVKVECQGLQDRTSSSQQASQTVWKSRPEKVKAL